MKKSIVFWQFVGFIFVGITGTLFHFVFDWFNRNVIVGMFSPVNESIWEHIKLIYFPSLIFALVENKFIGRENKNFWASKAIGILIGTLLIPALYYTYTGAFGVKFDWFNILIFFISASVVFFVETKILKNSQGFLISPTVSKIFIFVLGALFIIFTFAPPEIPIFQDPLNRTYGLWRIT